MSKCVGRLCGDKVPGMKPFRYNEKQCAKACAEGSDLCLLCEAHEEANMAGEPIAKSKWHGRMGGPIHKKSHVLGSEWNMEQRMKAEAAAGRKKTTTRKAKKKTTSPSSPSSSSSSSSRRSTSKKSSSARKSSSAKKSNSAKKSSSARRKASASSVIYHPASSNRSNSRKNVRKGVTPISSNRQDPNPSTLQGIAANLAGLPELE